MLPVVWFFWGFFEWCPWKQQRVIVFSFVHHWGMYCIESSQDLKSCRETCFRRPAHIESYDMFPQPKMHSMTTMICLNGTEICSKVEQYIVKGHLLSFVLCALNQVSFFFVHYFYISKRFLLWGTTMRIQLLLICTLLCNLCLSWGSAFPGYEECGCFKQRYQ